MLLGYTAPTGYMFARLLRFPSLKINPENAYQSYYQSSAPEKSSNKSLQAPATLWTVLASGQSDGAVWRGAHTQCGGEVFSISQ